MPRYVISTLELMVAEDYMIVYLNGATPHRRMPGLGWLKKCYQMIDRRSALFTETSWHKNVHPLTGRGSIFLFLQAQEELEILHYSPPIMVYQDYSSHHKTLHKVKLTLGHFLLVLTFVAQGHILGNIIYIIKCIFIREVRKHCIHLSLFL